MENKTIIFLITGILICVGIAIAITLYLLGFFTSKPAANNNAPTPSPQVAPTMTQTAPNSTQAVPTSPTSLTSEQKDDSYFLAVKRNSMGTRYVKSRSSMCLDTTGPPEGNTLEEMLDNCKNHVIGGLGPCLGITQLTNDDGTLSFSGCLGLASIASRGGIPPNEEYWIEDSEVND